MAGFRPSLLTPGAPPRDAGASSRTVQIMNTLDEIMELAHRDVSGDHVVQNPRETVFLPGYEFGSDELARKLARQSYQGAWSATELDWDSPFEPDMLVPLRERVPRLPRFHPGNSWSVEEWQRYEIANLRYILSQGLHGEQLGVIVGGSLCQAGPTWDVKSFAGWMAVDEARHAEVFHRYLERVGGTYAMTDQMYSVIKEVLEAKEWDKVFVIGQVLIEGLGLGTFGYLLKTVQDPLLVEILRLSMRDEARHVAFGTNQLKSLLGDLTAKEIEERQELVAHCAELLVNRIIPVQVAEEFGIDPRQYVRAVRMSPALREMEMSLFAHIGPICNRLGLLDANGGKLRRDLETLGILDIPQGVRDEAEGVLRSTVEAAEELYERTGAELPAPLNAPPRG